MFVDLKKAFDAVNRELMWRLLHEKLGVPCNIIRLLKLMHDGMHVKIVFRGSLGRPVETKTGVR